MQIIALFNSVEYQIYKTDENGVDWYNFPLFPASTKDLDPSSKCLHAPLDTVLKALGENTRKDKRKAHKDEWIYKPEINDFITTIVTKVKTKVKRHDVGLKKIVPLNEESLKSSTQIYSPNGVNTTTDQIEEIEKKLAILKNLSYVADLISRRARIKQSKNLQHFEGFFTHDCTKALKNEDIGEISKECDAIIFPALCQILLTYLMLGSFRDLIDVSQNPLREGISLQKRIENVANCYSMGTTGKVYHAQYKKWLEKISPFPKKQKSKSK
jgi:hypothetical protein